MSRTMETDRHYTANHRLAHPQPGDEVVISGIAGRFPESTNIRHFQENLFNKVDLVTDDDRRWKLDHPEIPQRTGKIHGVEKFDALFFGVHFKQAHTMDPMCRMLLEHAYEAVIDAGINPRQLRGTRTGVFIGACFSESEKTWFYEKLQVNGFGITGCSRAMLANRLSYWLGANGPSYTVDSACSSSLYAMEHAYKAIRDGHCDAALVGGSNLCLHPYVSLQFSRLGVLAPDGRCKTFDADANGYARSETVAMVFLQKAKDAKRIYANVIHAKLNCDGFKEQGITFPSSTMQSVLLKEFYDECGVPPASLGFMEAHGTGTTVGDPEELTAIEKIFCKDRKTPLLVGSIKSNLGHSEPASGLCSVAKVVVAMETGLIPPNLNYNRPRAGVKALADGRIKVVTELTPWDGGYIGINSFGFGGANAHVLLKSNDKQKINGGSPNDNLPRLVVVSGRTEEAVQTMLDDVESRPVDVEFVRLLHDIHTEDTPGHIYRGYTVLPPRGLPETSKRSMQHYPGAKRPVWFVFSGMGSQWTTMGASLMEFPVFARAIEKCHATLKPHGVDLISVLTQNDPKIYENILNSFIGIAAVQIGLVDLLTSIGITPDNIIGHSVGELGCAYADGCFTAEQMISAAYARGLVSVETETIHGSMAAVGLGYSDLKGLCPPDIEIACHNASESATISGPAESMKNFVAKLQENKIFAKEVPCSNIAYHSRYIASLGPKLLSRLKKVIPDPKPRSSKWLSTSVPENQWGTKLAQYSSAEYHTNNLLNPVLFEETAYHIPDDAITIEIAPHGLLQAILKRSLNQNVTNVALTKRKHENNAEFLLQAMGKLYEVGLLPQLKNLYPEVQYPVSRGTPMISPLIRWNHTDDWYVTTYRMTDTMSTGERDVEVDLSDEDFEYMAGHVIDGRNLIPATGYLQLIWETIGLMQGEIFTEISVVFEDVKFIRATTIPKEGSLKLTLMIQKGTGRFEVIDGSSAVVTGVVRAVQNPSEESIDVTVAISKEESEDLTTKDVYKELRLRGYQYSGIFRGIHRASKTGAKGHITWSNNWVSFMDNMLQMHILGIDSQELFVPTSIQKLVIDAKTHSNLVRNLPLDAREIGVQCYKNLGVIVSGGIEIRGLKATSINRRKTAADPVLEKFEFVAHRDRARLPLDVITRLATHIALDNHVGIKIKTIELIDESQDIPAEDLTSPIIHKVLGDLPLLQSNVNVIASADKYPQDTLPATITVASLQQCQSESNALLIIAHGILARKKFNDLEQLSLTLKDDGFLLAREPLNRDTDVYSSASQQNMDIILEKRTEKELILLLRRRAEPINITSIIHVRNNELSWLSHLQAALRAESETEQNSNRRILLIGEGDFENGILGLVNCLRKEPGGEIVRAMFIQDLQAPEFSLENPLYSEQLKLDILHNVLRPDNLWGSYKFVPLDPLTPKPVYHAMINQLTSSDMSSLKWIQGPIRPSLNPANLTRIHYSSVNFRDIMVSSGKLSVGALAKLKNNMVKTPLGFEYSGRRMSDGRSVMGILENGGLSNLCEYDPYLQWETPENWSLEEAATVPVVYATCYYALYLSGGMKKGQKVLIHAGSGGVGQAAITLALNEGCEVFTTVGTPEKRDFIKTRFPQIDDSHIGNSRDTSFEQLILRKTQGKGVDIVLNSLAEEKLQASLRCLGHGGKFLEIGKVDLFANNSLGMECFLKEISFHGIHLDFVFTAAIEAKKRLHTLLGNGIKSGTVKPLPRTVFDNDQVETAFRFMAAGKHIGKVLIKIRDDNEARHILLPALGRFYCLEDSSYVIHGGLGGFGLELAEWLVTRGARKIVLTSRKGISAGYQRRRIHLWNNRGVKIVVVIGKDASTPEGCEAILKEATNLGPVDGIFNLAVVLRDSLCENQTTYTFEESLRVKAGATKQFDKLSRTLCPHLRQFVVFSSVSCGRGNAGQTNYGMANSIMERVCETRASESLPALAIEWGAVGDVGLVADMQEEHKEVVIGGTLQQSIRSCLAELDGFLLQNSPVVASMVVAEKKAGSGGATNIVDTVANIMALKDINTIGQLTSLAELGIDSMMAVDIKQTLETEFDLYLSAQEIRALNFAKLHELSARQAEIDKKRGKLSTHASEDLTGMKLLVRNLGTPEDGFETISVSLNTNAEKGGAHVFLLPGVEGAHSVFEKLAGKLRSPALCLQFKNTFSDISSIDDIVTTLVPHVKAVNQDSRTFLIAGYSFGSLVAIELARYLEAQGLTGRLVLIDGAPQYMKGIVEQQLAGNNQDEMESRILLGIMDILEPAVRGELITELQKCHTWDDKLQTFSDMLPESISATYPREYQRSTCTAIYKRIQAVLNYDSSSLPRIRSPIILLRPDVKVTYTKLADYGLSSVTQGKVETYFIEGNHITIVDSDMTAAAINGDPLENPETFKASIMTDGKILEPIVNHTSPAQPQRT